MAAELSVSQAAQHLARGEVVAFATETVYGLGADAQNSAAVEKIFALKGRPSWHPLIVHVLDAAAAQRFASAVPPWADRLMQNFWPGPLTLILPRRPGMADTAAAGQTSVGLRCPAHPLARELLQACAALPAPLLGIAAPSANRFGRVSASTAAHVWAEFGAAVPVLDGGPCVLGIESTIVDCTRQGPVLLRPGAITAAQIEAACGHKLLSKEELATPDPRAAGTLKAHYAPRMPLRLMDAQALQTALDLWPGDKAQRPLAIYARSALKTPASVLLRRMPSDAALAAHELFAVLRDFEDANAAALWVETPPATPDWAAVADRLQRAAAGAGEKVTDS